jgi:hypothetical protein
MRRFVSRVSLIRVVAVAALLVPMLATATTASPDEASASPRLVAQETPTPISPSPPANAGRVGRGWPAAFSLLFGLISILAVLIFVFFDRARSLSSMLRLAKGGITSLPVSTPAVSPGVSEVDELAIVGPGTIVVGVPSSFVARKGDSLQKVAWAASEKKIQGQLPKELVDSIVIAATDAGTFELTASTGGDPPAKDSRRIAGVSPGATTLQRLPFIGGGWGSIVVALAIASVTGALGLEGTLSGEAVATIFGALVGYVVAKGQGERRKGETSETSTEDAQ